MLNEFRQDLVSGEWVLYATNRAKRPQTKPTLGLSKSKTDCPFDRLSKENNELIKGYPDDKNWEIMVIKNKYPVVQSGLCAPGESVGPFKTHFGSGSHEVIVFHDHDKTFYDFSVEDKVKAVRVYKDRYKVLSNDGCAKYIMIFNNHGVAAGASIYHPHSQIISSPIVPPDVARSLSGAYDYHKKNKKRVYDNILNWEVKEKKRIVCENDHFVAFCPFVSKYPYEIRIFSKESHAHFEQMPDEQDEFLAEVFQTALKKISKALQAPPFNFFIHTASVGDEIFDGKSIPPHEYYHWHLELIPHIKFDAGFEIGTGMAVNVIDPDDAAKLLRETNV